MRILSQGLPAPRAAKLPAQLAQSGYLRTLGGADVYLAARARCPKMRRGDLEALVVEHQLRVSPAVRGCIYLVPHEDAALCLSIAREQSRARDERDAEKSGIKKGELADVGDAIVAVLREQGPQTTDGLRRVLPKGVVRSLGDRGKKVGVSSTLPPALRQMEFAGRIERTPVDGHLDHEKYLWAVTDKDPFADADLPDDTAQLHARLFSHFLERAGVSTLKAFSDWSGLTQRDVKLALAHTPHEVVQAEGMGDEALAAPTLGARLRKLDQAEEPVALLPFEDNLAHLAGGIGALVHESAHDLQVPTWGNMKQKHAREPLGTAKHVMFRAILAEGRVRGFWEYDPDAKCVVTHLFDAPSKAARAAVAAAAESLSAFLTDELGHGHSFSLDNDDELRRRLSLLTNLGRA